MRRRVLILDTNTEIGGVVTVLLSLLRRFDPEALDVTVCCQRGGRPAALMADIPGLRRVECRFGTKPSAWRSGPLTRTYDLLALPLLAVTVLRIAWVVVSRRVEVILTSDKVKSVLVADLVSRLTGRPLVYHAHAVCVPNAVNRAALSRARRIVANSQAMKDDFVRALGPEMERIEVVHNGVEVGDGGAGDLREELGIPAAAVVVGAASRLAPNKGQADLVKAARHVLDAAPETWFLVAGDDAIDDGNSGYRAELEALARDLGVADRVLFLGFRSDMDAFYRTCDVVVDAAWEEPFGMVVIEPMVHGRPVVGTDAGGIPEIIDDGVNGRLVPPRDPAALGRVLLELATDDAGRRALGEGARRVVRERFDITRQVRRMTGILQEVAS